MTLQNFTLGTFAQGAAGGGAAFESIATATGTGSSGTITFSSIPSTYQHLQIRGMARNDSAGTAGDVSLRFNSDTGTNYAYHQLRGTGSSATATATASATLITLANFNVRSGVAANILGTVIIDILDYASTSKNKTIRAFDGYDINSTTSSINLHSGVWLSTSAITSISLISDAGNFTTQTTFALYGIKGA